MRRPLLGACICLFVGIALWMQFKNPPPRDGELTCWEGEQILLIGQVYEKEFRQRNGEQLLILYLKSILYSTEADASYLQIKQASKKLSEINPTDNLICEINLSQRTKGSFLPMLGSEVLLRGEWQSMAHATNPGEFDAADYYRIEGIGARLKQAELLGVGTKGWPLREFLYQLRQHWCENLYAEFPEKEAAILAKMLLGIGSGLDDEVQELYQNNGIVHILSISGLHITMLGMGLYWGLRRFGCPMWIAAVCGGMVITGYGLMIGFGVSAYRAIGMYLIHMLGEIWGRTYDMLTAMGVLAVIMLLENPLLVYYSGFLLSFASVCGVGVLSPLLQLPKEWFQKRPGEHKWLGYWKKGLKKIAAGLGGSMAVTIFTLPIQLFFFYKIPVYSVLMNLLVIPFMGVVMSVGFLVMLLPVFGFLSPIETGIFQWFEWLCHGFEKLPGHTWVIGKPAMWQIIVYYVLLLGILLGSKYIKGGIRFISLTVLVLFLSWKDKPELKITLLDVGQGECICVQMKEGQCFLFDCGSSSKQKLAEKIIIPFLQHEGIDRIEGVFLSHLDTDHTSGILQLLESGEIPIEEIYLPHISEKMVQDSEFLQLALEKSHLQYVACNDSFVQGEVHLSCLHPEAVVEEGDNANSACYLLQAEEFRMLLTGDVEGQGEEMLTSQLQKRGIHRVDVLKVAHHGSNSSTSETFLQELDMQLAVISCGRNNRYGHPHKETLTRLEQEGCVLMVTAKTGAITIEVEGRIKVYGFSEKNPTQ